MAQKHQRGDAIRQFILNNLWEHPRDIAGLASQQFSVTRQAINKHIRKLIAQDQVKAHGHTRNRRYWICPQWDNLYEIDGKLNEAQVWRSDIQVQLHGLPENVRQLWQYGFTEIFNNALDHSSGKHIYVQVFRTEAYVEIIIHDDGVGIFRKIQQSLDLYDERHSVLELAKGKLTTDPERHSGEGIFFVTKMFDDFNILSRDVHFYHTDTENWIVKNPVFQSGTAVFMKLPSQTQKTTQQEFNRFSSDKDFRFNKTIVPVRLAEYGDDKLVSRSQAKRLLYRFDRFDVVLLDFDQVDFIGQAFADEVFRVFQIQHPEIEIAHENACNDVLQMIKRAIHKD